MGRDDDEAGSESELNHTKKTPMPAGNSCTFQRVKLQSKIGQFKIGKIASASAYASAYAPLLFKAVAGAVIFAIFTFCNQLS
jgi:hypothetical protein